MQNEDHKMQQEGIRLFVIIVTYNALPWIERCIDSVKQSSISNHVVVIDNNSTDRTLALVKESYKNIQIIAQTKNIGFGQANNLGITYALQNGADYVYLLNQDAWVQAETFEKLINIQRRYPEYGIISPIQTTANPIKLDKSFLLSCKSNAGDFLEDLYFNRTKELYSIEFVPAAHWLISRKCLLSVGGFSPTYFHYGEDGDYLNRVLFHHFRVGFCPQTSAVHDREYRVDTREKQMYLVFISLVNACSRIHKRSLATILNSFYYLFKMSFRHKSLAAITYTGKLLFLYPKIVRNRRIARRAYPNFLGVTSITTQLVSEQLTE